MDVVARELVIEPGASTGWHYHHTEIAALVKSGTLTRTLHDGTVEVSVPGDFFVERAGARHVHVGQNLGTRPVVLHVTYALPEGAPFAVPAEAPPCCRAAQTRRRISPRTR
ncbi:cupin domain-containing protein [Streptomyces bambusae]|uniref:Cupin domain-containing protein n=1 Tax=Streptomyces bambusae TaxID=1550616 RepID=A0ABS6ZFS0_9ACTN|nr:cupin domain-containing protein [Streptomyces bambusae]MBW5486602.1 cupin domain-containing protein [Streptomyces bambusae]